MRLAGENERVLSLPDDYFSVFLTSLFIALAFAMLLQAGWLPVFYIVTAYPVHLCAIQQDPPLCLFLLFQVLFWTQFWTSRRYRSAQR